MPRGRPRKSSTTTHDPVVVNAGGKAEGVSAPSAAPAVDNHSGHRWVLRANVVYRGAILSAGTEVSEEVAAELAEYCDVRDG